MPAAGAWVQLFSVEGTESSSLSLYFSLSRIFKMRGQSRGETLKFEIFPHVKNAEQLSFR